MAAQAKALQATLPMALFDRLQNLRRRYGKALKAAAAGDFSLEQHLRAVSKAVGHLLAEEAKKPPEERGGLRMLDLSLAVDTFFPELRGWNQHELLRQSRQHILAHMAQAAQKKQERAS